MGKINFENKLIAIVRVRGRIKVREPIEETMERLNLRKPNMLAIVYATKPYVGMINKCRDFVTFGEIDKQTLLRLIEKNGKKVDDGLLDDLISGKKSLKEIEIQPFFRLHPPRKGYEKTRLPYSTGGAVGYRGNAINELIRRMT
ncbi:MAG: uL30 family ribosomal protein [Candidatus Micrarchaeia archaeon]